MSDPTAPVPPLDPTIPPTPSMEDPLVIDGPAQGYQQPEAVLRKPQPSAALIILSVAVGILLLAVIAASVVLVQTRTKLESTQATLATTQATLTTTNQQLSTAQEDARSAQSEADSNGAAAESNKTAATEGLECINTLLESGSNITDNPEYALRVLENGQDQCIDAIDALQNLDSTSGV